MSKEKQYILDRFEGEFAILEKYDLSFLTIDRNLLPKNVKEGDVLIKKNSNFIIDCEKTEIRKEEIKNKLNTLFDKD